MYFLYYLTSKIDGYIPRYIGYTTDLKRRLGEHLNHLNNKSHKVNWIKKVLKHNEKVEIYKITESESLVDILDLEKKHIFKSKNLTNGTSGGEVSKTFVKSVKERISKSLKEYYKSHNAWNKDLNYKLTKEQLLKRKQPDIKGTKNPFFNKKHTDITKSKISASRSRLKRFTFCELYNHYIIKNLTMKEFVNLYKDETSIKSLQIQLSKHLLPKLKKNKRNKKQI